MEFTFTAPHLLSSLVAGLEATQEPLRSAALLQTAAHSGGEYNSPGSATHLHELTLLGVHARGEDLESLTRNWLRAATNIVGGDHPRIVHIAELALEQRLQSLAKALGVIARPDLHRPESIQLACKTVLAEAPVGHYAHERARLLAEAIRREGAEVIKCNA